jgi:hypothetical protein
MRHETRPVTVRTRWLTNGLMTPHSGSAPTVFYDLRADGRTTCAPMGAAKNAPRASRQGRLALHEAQRGAFCCKRCRASRSPPLSGRPAADAFPMNRFSGLTQFRAKP